MSPIAGATWISLFNDYEKSCQEDVICGAELLATSLIQISGNYHLHSLRSPAPSALYLVSGKILRDPVSPPIGIGWEFAFNFKQSTNTRKESVVPQRIRSVPLLDEQPL
jgi:hypothetical protein